MPDADTQQVLTKTLFCYSRHMAISEQQLRGALSRTPSNCGSSDKLGRPLPNGCSDPYWVTRELLANGP